MILQSTRRFLAVARTIAPPTHAAATRGDPGFTFPDPQRMPDTVPNNRSAWIGALLVSGGAMLFATKGIFAKKLFELGVEVEALVAIRAAIAVPVFWMFAASREGLGPLWETPPRAALAAAGAGFLCYYGGALLDFHALTMIDASIERVLMFSYPAMVVLYTALRDRAWPTPRVLLALLLTYAGIFLVVGGLDGRALRANALGALLVIGSAMTYAAYFLIGERYTRQIGSSRFTLIAMTSATLALVLHYLLRHGPGELAALPSAAWPMLIALGVLVMFVPALMQAEGIRRIGAERGAVVSTAGPPMTIALAWLVLDERMSPWQFAGVAAIVAGILVLDLSRGKPQRP
jgi:drug/metabolite transporter (DMT)-like permease